jgi:hypothetical protein
MNKESVLVVVPTTASRLTLLKEVLDKLYENNNLHIKTIIVKNGTFSDEEYDNFNFELPNVIKTKSSPGELIYNLLIITLVVIELEHQNGNTLMCRFI